jgi:hypothetical protein
MHGTRQLNKMSGMDSGDAVVLESAKCNDILFSTNSMGHAQSAIWRLGYFESLKMVANVASYATCHCNQIYFITLFVLH